MEDCMAIKIKHKNLIVDGRIWYDYVSEDSEMLILHIEGEDISESAQALDCFSALIEVRRKLEKKDAYPLVMGANKRVYPSPMQRNMGDGRSAYMQRMGAPAVMSDCVDIFEPCNYEDISTVVEQEQYHNRWISEKLQKNKHE